MLSRRLWGFATSFSSHVRWCERGAPGQSGLVGKRGARVSVSKEVSSDLLRDLLQCIFLHIRRCCGRLRPAGTVGHGEMKIANPPAHHVNTSAARAANLAPLSLVADALQLCAPSRAGGNWAFADKNLQRVAGSLSQKYAGAPSYIRHRYFHRYLSAQHCGSASLGQPRARILRAGRRIVIGNTRLVIASLFLSGQSRQQHQEKQSSMPHGDR